MTCEHGQLQRQCETCDLTAQWSAAVRWARRWKRAAKLEYGATKANRFFIDECYRLRTQLAAAQKVVEAAKKLPPMHSTSCNAMRKRNVKCDCAGGELSAALEDLESEC